MSDPSKKLALRIHDEVGSDDTSLVLVLTCPAVQWKRRLLFRYLHVQAVPHLRHRGGRQGSSEWRQRCCHLLPEGRQSPWRGHKGMFYSQSFLLLHEKLT